SRPEPRSTRVKQRDLLTNTLIRRDGAGSCWPVHQCTPSSGSSTEIEPSGVAQVGICAVCSLRRSCALCRCANAGATTAAITTAESATAAARLPENTDIFVYPLVFILKCRSRTRPARPPPRGPRRIPPTHPRKAHPSKRRIRNRGQASASVGIPPHQELVPEALEEARLLDRLQRHQ